MTLAMAAPALESGSQQFLRDVVAGLSASPKTLPCKYFYDHRGSDLFEKICGTNEYYVTRTEMGIYQHCADDMAEHIGPCAHIIEPGAGALKKVAPLLAALDSPLAYSPLDISADFLLHCSQKLQRQFPELAIHPGAVDFNDHAALIRSLRQQRLDGSKRVIFFPGSTIGNFAPAAAVRFMASMAQGLVAGDGLLIGVDLVKPPETLERAYNDTAGYTAAFNKNLLLRIRRELAAELEPDNFAHLAKFNERESRVEMHLRSEVDQVARVNGHEFRFARGETIHTENSYKFTLQGFVALAAKAGFEAMAQWTDDAKLFSVHYLRRQ